MKKVDLAIRNRVKELRMVKASELQSHSQNWRRHPSFQQSVMWDVLAEIGFAGAILARETPEGLQIIDGHLRAEVTGNQEVPVLVLDVDEAEAKKLLATFDPIGALAQPDNDALTKLLAGIDFGSKAIDDMLADLVDLNGQAKEGLTEDDEIPEKVETICKTGDLWQLGDHRLLCGDATKREDVERLMGEKKADMVFTDPPFGVDYDGTHLSGGSYFSKGKREKERLKNDDRDVYKEVMPIIFSFLKDDQVCVYICFAGTLGKAVFDAVHDSQFMVRALIIWNKNHAQFGSMGSQYKQKHEPILYLYKKGKTTQWFGENNEVTVWDIDRQSKNEFHLTQKPVELSARAIKNSSKLADIILDLFGGSGSTLIACEKLGRKCRMMEIEPFYCDVIIQRWENFTGQKAVKL